MSPKVDGSDEAVNPNVDGCGYDPTSKHEEQRRRKSRTSGDGGEDLQCIGFQPRDGAELVLVERLDRKWNRSVSRPGSDPLEFRADHTSGLKLRMGEWRGRRGRARSTHLMSLSVFHVAERSNHPIAHLDKQANVGLGVGLGIGPGPVLRARQPHELEVAHAGWVVDNGIWVRLEVFEGEADFVE